MNQTGNGNALASPQVQKMTYAGLMLAVAMVLPFVTGQIPQIGQMLSPMHLPVLLCGFLCGWPWGMAVGFVSPLLRSVLFGMPAMFPGAVSMAFELAVYGGLTGFLRRKLAGGKIQIYLTLLIAMIAGRVVWGLVRYVLAGLSGGTFTFDMFLAGAILNALPGIALPAVLIPLLVMALEKAGVSPTRPQE